MSRGNIIVRMASALWRGLNALRKILHLLLLLVIFAVLMAGVVGPPVQVPARAALVVDLKGDLVEELEGNPLDRALGELEGDGIRQTRVRDVIDSLEAAVKDDRIQAVVLRLDALEGGGLPKLQAVAKEIGKVRAAGKKVVALGDNFDQNQYYLAAHADEIYLNDLGQVYIDGYGYYRTYFRSAIEKLRIDLNVFRVGEYKSFVEPYIRDNMSEEDKAASSRWLQGLWTVYQRDVSAARKLEAGKLDEYANGLAEHMKAAGGAAAKVAIDKRLVDGLMSRQQFRDHMIGLVGAADDDKGDFSGIGFRSYLAAQRRTESMRGKAENVGIIVASGVIMDGRGTPGAIGGDTLAEQIHQAATDDSIKAVVIRVDSPGGSMFASEVILDEIGALKAAGKPVIASMSSVAASGGYYIAMLSDEIWANEATITGSIGVGAVLPTLQRGLDGLGVHVDGIGTTGLAGQLRLDRELGADARSYLEQGVQEAYRVFVGKVAESRKMTYERADGIARGRVWIGADARDLGLVDGLGDLAAAVEAAAAKAGLAAGSYGTTYVEPEMSWPERLALEYALGWVRWAQVAGVDTGLWQRSIWERVLGVAGRELGRLAQLNDPRGIYAYCLCEAP
jgi:protease-4